MPVNSVVITREIWDGRNLIGNVLEGDAIRATLTTRFDPEDLNALEVALQVRDEYEGQVSVLSIGRSRGVDVLREALYRGASRVIRLEDEAFQNLDTAAESAVYAAAINKLSAVDLVFCGVNINEGENALLGAMIAQRLNSNQISYVDNLEQISEGTVICRRAVEMGFERVQSRFPTVINIGIALVQDDPRTPRSAKAALKLKLKKAPIEIWNAQDLELNDPAGMKKTLLVRRETIEQREVESRPVDPENEAELKAMLESVRL